MVNAGLRAVALLIFVGLLVAVGLSPNAMFPLVSGFAIGLVIGWIRDRRKGSEA